MANEKIHEYSSVVTTLSNDSRLDTDYWNGSAFVSSQIKFSDLLAQMQSPNLGNQDLISTTSTRSFKLFGDAEANEFSFKNNSGVKSLIINGKGDVYNGTNSNTLNGFNVGRGLTGSRNAAFGYEALGGGIGAANNVAFGNAAGKVISTGPNNESSSEGTFIGSETKPFAAVSMREIVIGFGAIGKGSNTTTISDSSNLSTNLFGDVIAKSNASLDNGFLVHDSNSVLKANLGFDVSLASAKLELKNAGGTFFSAVDGEIDFFTRALLTYNSGNNRVHLAQGFSQLNLQPTVRVNCAADFHVTNINSAGGGSNTSIVLGSNAMSYKGSNTSSGGINHSFNTSLLVADASNSIMSVSNFGTRLFDVKSNGNAGFGTSTPHSSSILDLSSTVKGFSPPEMTTTQKNAISSPKASLMVYDTTLNKMCFYSGSAWETITSS